jgi:DNA-binding CsgD family transcriptional regulator
MPWLADIDVGAARRFVRAIADAGSLPELHRRTPADLGELVGADVVAWDRVDLASGVVRHTMLPDDAEPAGAFDAVVGDASGHPLLAAHAAAQRSALRLSDVVEPRDLTHSALYGDLLHGSGVEYEIAISVRTGRGEALVAGLGRSERGFSERDREMLDLVRPGLELVLRAAEARVRLVHALAADPPPGTAVILLNRDGEIELSSGDAERWLAEHFGAAEHPGWLPAALAEWLALPPRPPLVSVREGRCLRIQLLPGDPHALLLEEDVASFRPEALRRLGLTAREREVLGAAAVLEATEEIASELFLSARAVREVLERIDAKLGVASPQAAVARMFRESV